MDSNLKDILLEELSSENVNLLKIRKMCLQSPGLISTAGLRVKIWSLFLLGSQNLSQYTELSLSNVECKESHVLEADVKRTRADIEEFRSASWRNSLTVILQTFCSKHSIQYKQGMNEVLAPFLYMQPPPIPSSVSYTLFEAFLFRYLERYFCVDDSSYLFKSFRLFHILLLYHDPQLALHLQENEFFPEFYAPQWFLTLYSRSLPISHVLRLWDMMISIDDPAFNFFIGLCLLKRRRTELLSANSDDVPEIISIVGLCLDGEDDVDSVILDALLTYQQTPRCYLRNLRLCCVSVVDFNPTPISGSKIGSSPRIHTKDIFQDIGMAEQSVRSSIMLSAHELVSNLAPMISPTSDLNFNDINPTSSILPNSSSKFVTQQYLVMDIRSESDIEMMGGGILPKSIRIDPDFLDRPDAMDAWLQHIDSMRGSCGICVIDMPPKKLTEVALWRRLLLGEGDGVTTRTLYGNRYDHQEDQESGIPPQDRDSPFWEYEEKAKENDRCRLSAQLVKALQKAHFPYVTALDGGLPVLVRYMMSSRGTVEPIIINHDHSKWLTYLHKNGLETENDLERKSNRFQDHNVNEEEMIAEKVEEMSKLEITLLAHKVAVRLGHTHMEAVLLERIHKYQSLTEKYK